MFDDAFEKCWYVTRNGDDTLKKVEQIRSDALDKRTERVPSSVELAVVWEKDYDQATESWFHNSTSFVIQSKWPDNETRFRYTDSLTRYPANFGRITSWFYYTAILAG